MIFTIDNLFTPEQLAIIAERLKPEDFIDGKITAGWHASKVKENTQLFSKAAYAQEIKLSRSRLTGRRSSSHYFLKLASLKQALSY